MIEFVTRRFWATRRTAKSHRCKMCTTLCTDGVERVDDVRKVVGIKKGSGITLCLCEFLLTARFKRYSLVIVPESARQPGRRNQGFGPGSIATRGAAESEQDRVHSHLGELPTSSDEVTFG